MYDVTIGQRLPRTFRDLGLLALVVYSLLHFFQSGAGGLTAAAADRCTGDFEGSFPAAAFRAVNPALFDQFPVFQDKAEGLWNYGPLYHVVTLPLLLLPDRGAACSVWLLANILFAAAAAYLLFVSVFDRSLVSRPLVVLYLSAWLNFFPLIEAVRQGVIEVFELLLVVAIYVCLAAERSDRLPARARRDVTLGVLVASATMTKFLPGIFFPYLAVKRRWKALLGGSLCLFGMAVLFQCWLDWRLSFVVGRRSTIGIDSMLDPRSQSLASLVLRSFAHFPEGRAATIRPLLSPESESTALLTARVAIIIAVGLLSMLFLLRRRSTRVDMECALLSAFMIFVPQYSWPHYQVFLMIPISIMLKLLWQNEGTSKVWWALFLAFYVSTGSLIIPSSFVDRVFGLDLGGFHRVLQSSSLPALGNLGISAFFAVGYWRPLRVHGSPPANAREVP